MTRKQFLEIKARADTRRVNESLDGAEWAQVIGDIDDLVGAIDPDRKGSLGNLLDRAVEFFCDTERAPDGDWLHDYFVAMRQPMILTEEGWEPIEAEASYLADDPDWKPIDRLVFEQEEVNVDAPDVVRPHEVAASLQAEADELRASLAESLKLQSHYARLLNDYDCGERRTFSSPDEWMARLRECREIGTAPPIPLRKEKP